MDPLTEENKKLKVAVKLMEKNVRKAQRERDLAESNAKDLEYQKGILSEQLKTISEQLEHTSKQLSTVSEQLGRTSEQLKSISNQKKGILGQCVYSALPNSLDVAVDHYIFGARCGAWLVASSHRSTPRGEGEGI